MTPVTRSHGHGEGSASGSTPGGSMDDAPSTSREPSRRRSDEEKGQGRLDNESRENESDGEEDDDVDADEEDDDDEDEEDEEDDGPVRSPLTELSYNIDSLDDENQEIVRELFRAPAPEETPPMVIEWCGISNDPDVYAFQLQEIVPRTIRIGSPTSRIPRPSCNCTGTASTPCRHLVWLMDQIAKQTLHDHHPDEPLVLDGATAFPHAMGAGGQDAYAKIAGFHIDILANTLHCGAGRPPVTGSMGRLNRYRVREAREILAGLDGVQDDESVDTYAPEIFDQSQPELESLLWGTERREDDDQEQDGGSSDDDEDDDDDRMDDDEEGPPGKDKGKGVAKAGSIENGPRSSDHAGEREGGGGIQRQNESQRRQQRHRGAKDEQVRVIRDLVERGDLQRTVLRLLVSNDEFFAMFLKLLAPSDKARDPFRKIQQRVEAVLEALLEVRSSAQHQQQQQSRLLMPPPDPRTRRTAAPAATPIITVTDATSASAPAPPHPPSFSDKGNGSVTVAWAAQHVEHAVHQIHLLLQRQLPRPPKPWARRSAGRALVWILYALVFFHNRDAHVGATQDDRNLYQRLVGNSDGSVSLSSSLSSSSDENGLKFFLLDVLAPLHDQTHLRSQLKRIRRRIQVNGYREPYMRRLDEILAMMNAAAEKEETSDAPSLVPSASMAGSKRHGSNTNTPTERRPKRMR
ncbi:hypothetical protein SPBR_08249 [Sporothrix brasiliensis 5110]|uniref:SWIM-type domain-containing protein n=1 Tax=Sporothrix brasiliensis 5110 TaxID=1398154 RepID=A0A0C2IBN2_9PEZI|nr:uncharacterized protein SPBR_08249 [Sporothrix brasiliensis 5110]KIH86671.1 hypothetical protein SPBR_08249 [Sporothrix brasiliensis 5110]